MTTNQYRDTFLDIAKGLAIILVIVGHVIQGSSENFDDLLWFRVIYSFHMPLFVFLSGAVAAIAFQSDSVQHGIKANLQQAKTKIAKAAVRLLLPFIAWCVINQLIYHHSDNVMSALILAFRRPDTALWFLLAIFYCIVLAALFNIFFSVIYELSTRGRLKEATKWICDGRVQIVLMILIWWAIREHTPRGAGLSLIRPYFIYYVLGIGFYKYLYLKISTWKYLPAWIIFIALIPFWSRTAADNIDGVTWIPLALSYFYAGLVALSGSFLILGIAKWISETNIKLIKNFLILCGQLSLGIYAIHYFFLAYSPKVIAPLLMSVGIAYGINRIPGFRTLLLGER
ncbi:acyltransferase family protein [Polynucleobacter sp. AP-Melu-500A-A1]|uniref:acyltransferase family protein n=1 Tax=Polynucleobacter sp. AP-Melu-500A-A1 TaxID=2576929 RepID=UPI001C0AC1AA|nr:acyltransferase family protein [Polynucleobacter sp. AP-Melu-500A-A1]MBU3631648.1 acyltransferase family protein [Polynucleobacter sp. AP-Melu-500A-A1]